MDDRRVTIPIIVGLVIFFLMFSTQAYAYTIEYEPIGYKLKQKPTICAFEPSDPDLAKWEIEKLLEQTRIASSEWEVKLQSAVNYQKNKDSWEIDYLQINKDQPDDTVDCTINVLYEKKPKIPVQENRILGIAKLDPVSETWNVTVYYLQTELQYTTGYIGDDSQKYYWYEPYYGEELRTSIQLGTLIRHELGHALGLGHHESDNYLVNYEWAAGSKPSPSIMSPIISENSREQKILAKDIDLMRSLYGENGFLPDSDVDDFSFYKAKMFIENDMFEEALSYVENYIQINPEEDPLYYKAEALWEMDQYSEAGKIVDKVLEINPENIDAMYIKGKSLAKSKNYDEAIEIFDKVLEIEPLHDNALSYKGRVLYEQEMYEEAGKYFFESYDINRYNVSNLNRIGYWLEGYGEYEDAFWFYDLALSIEPNKRSVLNNKGDALYQLERYEEAIEHFDKVLEMYPNNEYALNKKALSLEELGEFDKAKELFDKLEEIESETSSTETLQTKETEQTEPVQESELIQKSDSDKSNIPDWVRGNAEWWAQGAIDDSDFVSGIQYLIKEGIMTIPETEQGTTGDDSGEIPSWIKNNADWWAQGLITDDDFVKGIQYLVEQGIIVI